MSLSFVELNDKYRNLSLLCVVGGVIFGLILGTLIVGTLYVMMPSAMLAIFTGVGCYILWSVCIAVAVALTCFMVYQIKQLNKSIKAYKENAEK